MSQSLPVTVLSLVTPYLWLTVNRLGCVLRCVRQRYTAAEPTGQLRGARNHLPIVSFGCVLHFLIFPWHDLASLSLA